MNNKLFIGLQYLLPTHLLSRFIGFAIRCEWSFFKKALFGWYIKKYNIDMSLAQEEDPLAYANFNDFFTRALKPERRPICSEANSIACPVDGNVSQLGTIEQGELIQAKGMTYTTETLLADAAIAERFQSGLFATLYLSPRDYHRIHMPVTGTLKTMIHVPGDLFSVNPVTADNVPNLFARNERVVCLFDTDKGELALVLVGAMIVASIATTWAGLITPPTKKTVTRIDYDDTSITLQKGEEMGHFQLGSTVVMLLNNTQASFADTLGPGADIIMGQSIGQME